MFIDLHWLLVFTCFGNYYVIFDLEVTERNGSNDHRGIQVEYILFCNTLHDSMGSFRDVK
jgi:hypothetical protein